jgi:hypothetical protein
MLFMMFDVASTACNRKIPFTRLAPLYFAFPRSILAGPSLEFFNSEMSAQIDSEDEEEISRAKLSKVKLVVAYSKVALLSIVDQVEFGTQILLQFLIHDKEVDSAIKFFFNYLRKQSTTAERSILFNAISKVRFLNLNFIIYS